MSKKFIEAGFPAPNQYDDWRSWAAAFLGALDGLSGEDVTNLPLYVRKEGEAREGLPVGAEGDLIRVRDEDGKNRLYVYEDAEGWKSTQEAIEVDLSGKADIDLGNTTDNIDYVIESYNDGTNWYRIYKSGWIDQGGIYTRSVSTNWNTTITFLKPFKEADYNIQISAAGLAGDKLGEHGENIENKTTTSFSYYYYTGASGDGTAGMHWRACGQGASL